MKLKLKKSASMVLEMVKLINGNNKAYLDVSIRCRDGTFKTSALILAAASPWWASVLSKDGEENFVVLPDETCASLRNYLQALFKYNAIYSRNPVGKTFRVDAKGQLKELRPFVYPEVCIPILDRRQRDQLERTVQPSVIRLGPASKTSRPAPASQKRKLFEIGAGDEDSVQESHSKAPKIISLTKSPKNVKRLSQEKICDSIVKETRSQPKLSVVSSPPSQPKMCSTKTSATSSISTGKKGISCEIVSMKKDGGLTEPSAQSGLTTTTPFSPPKKALLGKISGLGKTVGYTPGRARVRIFQVQCETPFPDSISSTKPFVDNEPSSEVASPVNLIPAEPEIIDLEAANYEPITATKIDLVSEPTEPATIDLASTDEESKPGSKTDLVSEMKVEPANEVVDFDSLPSPLEDSHEEVSEETTGWQENSYFEEDVHEDTNENLPEVPKLSNDLYGENNTVRLNQRLENMKVKGYLCLLASDGKSKAKILLDSSHLPGIHSALHYFEMVSLDKINICKVVQNVNAVEKSNRKLEPTDSLYKNAVELLKDVDELDTLEKDVFDSVMAKEVDRPFESTAQQQDCFVSSLDGGASQALKNPSLMSGLEETVEITSELDEHCIKSYQVLSVSNGEITDGVEVASCDNDERMSWFQGQPPENVIAMVLKAFTEGEGFSLGDYLKATCRVLANHMVELRREVEDTYQKVMARGGHTSVCRGCRVQFDCLTLAQKRIQRQHKHLCGSHTDKRVTNTLMDRKMGDRYKDFIDNDDRSLYDRQPEPQLNEMQLAMTPEFISFEEDVTRECLFVITQANKCLLLLMSGEDNVNMVHGAAHLLTSLMGIDHRRLYCKLTMKQKHQQQYYYANEFSQRRRLFFIKGHDGELADTGIDKNVNQRVRSMIDNKEPLEFPEVAMQFCMARQNQTLKISEDFNYHPYSFDMSVVPFRYGAASVKSEAVKDLPEFAELMGSDNVQALVVCKWDPDRSCMLISQRVKLGQPEKKPDSAAIFSRDFDYNGMDTEDRDLTTEFRKDCVDKLCSLLDRFVAKRPVLLAALSRDICPYIRTNLNAAYREMSIELVKNLGKKREVCQCGITWRTLTAKEYRLWLNHRRNVHERREEYPCPYPGCNKWENSKSGVERHVGNMHGDQVMICDKCSYTTYKASCYKTHIRLCGVNFTCKICDMDFPKKYMNYHYKTKHEGHQKAACKVCGREVQARQMKNHIRDNHLPESEKKFQCEVCQKGFRTLSKINRHMKGHNR